MKKIVMMPDYRSGPYYQTLLAQALDNKGVKIVFPKRTKKIQFLFPIFRAVLRSNTKLLHMHWIDRYTGFRSKKIYVSLLKSILFMFDVYLIKKLLKTKIIWTLHNLYSHECSHPRIEQFIRTFFSNHVEVLICHCKQAKKQIITEFNTIPNKIKIIPIGNYIKCYKNDISRTNAREHLDLQSEDLVLLSFGAIRPYKGIENLIDCFNEINWGELGVKLLIVGKPVNDQIKLKLIKNSKTNQNIIFNFKFIQEDDIQLYFNASDIVVFSYKKILSSAGILLAMSFGKAIIAPKLGCIVDILDAKKAFLFNPQYKLGLLGALEKTKISAEKLNEMGQMNLKQAKIYDWEKIGSETKKIIDLF